MLGEIMNRPSLKATTIPPLRVSQELRRQAEAVLQKGETLSSFVLEALNRDIEHRKARKEFSARGLASAALAKETGTYISAGAVTKKLARRLANAKQRSV